MKENKKEYQVSAITKAMSVLEYLKEQKSASFTEIYTSLDLAKSSAYQLLKSLEHYNLITCSESGQYALGIKLFELGYEVGRNVDWRTVAQPFLKALAKKTGFTVHLAILAEDNRAFCLEKIEGEIYTMQLTRVGSPLHMHSSASGKALLAWQPEPLRSRIIDSIDFIQFNEHTITDRESLVCELERIRSDGYALDRQESEINCRGVGAPIFSKSGKELAAVSMGATLMEMGEADMVHYAQMVVDTCSDINSQLTI